MQDQIFERILDMINYSRKSEVMDGKIINAELDPEKFEMHLEISFPYILPIQVIAELNKALKEGMVREKIVNNIFITYRYDKEEIDSIALKDYYHYTVNALKEKKIIYRSLESFNVDFETNKVKLSVGKGNDEAIVKPLLEMVEKSFCVLGLNFVEFNIEINPFILPISETIFISRQEDMREAQSNISIESAKIVAKTEPKKEKTFKMRNQQKINGKVSRIADIPMNESALIEYIQKNGSANFVIVGIVSNSNITITKKGNFKIYQSTITDDSGSIIAKTFINSERNGLDIKFYQEKAHNGDRVRIYGYAEYDDFARDVVLRLIDIISHGPAESKATKTDDAIVKRVELHAHSKMTFLDSVLDIEDYVNRAVLYKHRAIALTDKNSVQGLGEFLHAIEKSKTDILPIYGMEASFVDEDKLKIAFDVEEEKKDINLKDATYVVLDFETTGLSPNYNQIIEIGACKVKNGVIIDEFSSFVNPKRQISTLITNLTSITNDDVRNAPFIEDILPKFKDFCDGCILVAHNAEFDSKHLYHNLRNLGLYEGKYPFFDTLGIARTKYNKKLKKFGLEDLCKLFNVSLEQHHRACDDAKATAQIFIKMLSDFANDNITNYKDIND
ncbi:MAG: PHP domain-containing protein, partial [Bacilli bacterium]|nr:PHP domain-containing protein [Bacilli bacterium]